MEVPPTHTRQNRRHDGHPPTGRRGTFKNKTWVSSGVTRGGARGRGFGSTQQERPGDASEVEDDAEVPAVVGGAVPSPSDEPVLETLEERERFYEEVSPRLLLFA